MKKNLRSLLFLALILTYGAAFAYRCHAAAFEDIGIGARGRGMGSAFTAMADDASALYWNPAQLTLVRSRELLTFYEDLYGLGLINYSFLGYVHPGVGKGTVAFGWTRLGTTPSVGAFDYAEHTFAFGYGHKMTPSLSLGASVKYYYVDYTSKASAFGADVGGSYSLWDDTVRLAFLWNNCNNPQLRWETLAVDDLPSILHGGLRIKVAEGHSAAFGAEHTLGQKTHLSAGWESWLMQKRALGIRAGASELDGYINSSVGLSFGYKGVRIDYSLERHYVLGYTSLISLSILL